MAVTPTSSNATTGVLTSPGIGSGLDINTIVSKLMSVEQQPLKLLDKKQADYQSDLSAYGTLNSLFAAFQGAMHKLADPANYTGLSASSSDTSIVTATAATSAAPGGYDISVTNTAQSQVLAANGVASAQNASSTGTLTVKVGTGAAKTVTIDASNNTLEGVRDAINAAGAGVTATIVNDGTASPFKLVLSAGTTGAANAIQVTNTLTAGELRDTVASLAEVRAAKDAALTVNGVAITSATNTVTTVIPGVTLSLIKGGNSTVTVARDSATVQGAVGSFVNAYNNVNDTIAKLTAYNAKTKQGGPLLGDSVAQNLQTQVRATLSHALAGTGNALTTLSQIGVSFQKDGSLALDSAKLNSAIGNNFAGIAALFSAQGKSDNTLVNFVSAGSKAVAGDYQVRITAAATQAAVTAAAPPAASTVIDGSNDGFAVTVDGIASGAVSIAHGTYTASQLATAVQNAINSSAALNAAAVTVTLTGGNLTIASKNYGTASTLSGVSGTALPALGFAGTETGTGTNVAGSFSRGGANYAATGVGQVLTASAGSDADSLQIRYTGTPAQLAGTGTFTLNYSDGYASLLYKFASGVLDPEGSLASRTAGLNASIDDIGNQRDALNRRLTQIEANYRAQFTALDRLISNLNSTSTFLTQQLASLNASTSTK